MHSYSYEDVAWERLKDMQREMENSGRFATQTLPAIASLVVALAERAWWLAGLAFRRAPRRAAEVRAGTAERECTDAAVRSDAA
jgi:hypothetical protein